jgi:quinohemoprotein ethanol dehydrogenase
MRARRRARVLPVLFLVGGLSLAVAFAASAGSKAVSPVPAPAFTGAQLSALSGNDWLGYNGNVLNQRHSSLSQINARNVKNLRVAWSQRLQLPGTKVRRGQAAAVFAEMTPVAFGGALYLPDGKNNVWALDGASGERLWINRPKLPKLLGIFSTSGTRGVAVGDGKIFMAAPPATLLAIDQQTGRRVWQKTTANPKIGHYYSNAPLYYDNKVITGSSGGDAGAPGFVTALNAKNGKELWRFQVIPQKPSDPGWGSWPTKRAYNGGGAMWNTPAVDPQLGLVYLVTGNPIPYSGIKRGPGKELFTDSILALDADTGKLRWYFQMVHHDIWDYDSTNAVILFNLRINGRMRQAIAHAGKTGYVYVFDRRTGKPIFGIPEVKVRQAPRSNTYPTQPIPVKGKFSKTCPDREQWAGKTAPDGKPYRIGCLFTPYDDTQWLVTAPNALGGANWPPSAYNPRTGFMYICSKDSEYTLKAVPAEDQKLQKLGDFFQVEGLFPEPGNPTVEYDGRLVAMNMRSNRVAWQQKWPGDLCYSGVLSTSGNLVFVGRNDGHLEAYHARTGRRLWRSPKLRGGVNAAPATYTVNGKQYVAVFAGGSGIAMFAGVKPFFGNRLYAFALPE